ncbi:MAG TPA: DUF438 domain-containing protein [bacterium]|nr:DUF438 domain-containing protein [bacterium]
MKISAKSKINEILAAYPALVDYLAAYRDKFSILRSEAMRRSIGRAATIASMAEIAEIPPAQLLEDLAAEMRRRNLPVTVDLTQTAMTRTERIAALREIIAALHDEGDFTALKARFDAVIAEITPGELAEMEEELIRGGLPVKEVQRMCSLHVDMVRDGLADESTAALPGGHPVHTYLLENRAIEARAARLDQLAKAPVLDWPELNAAVEDLRPLDIHYLRKENQLFPYLEKHGVTGPPQVMWGVHDQIRAQLKRLRAAVDAKDAGAVRDLAPGLCRDVVEMVFKEDRILFPLALATLEEAEWIEIARGDAQIGFAYVTPAASWPTGEATEAAAPGEGAGATVALATGNLTPEQLRLLLTHLPVDISFVDEDDRVRFYTDSPHRIFPRSPGVIGRKVQHCHPPDSVQVVERILTAFREGRKDTAEFWLELGGKFLHIRYFAVRDEQGAYRGTLEMMQDVTDIRGLSGARRLLNWDE